MIEQHDIQETLDELRENWGLAVHLIPTNL